MNFQFVIYSRLAFQFFIIYRQKFSWLHWSKFLSNINNVFLVNLRYKCILHWKNFKSYLNIFWRDTLYVHIIFVYKEKVTPDNFFCSKSIFVFEIYWWCYISNVCIIFLLLEEKREDVVAPVLIRGRYTIDKTHISILKLKILLRYTLIFWYHFTLSIFPLNIHYLYYYMYYLSSFRRKKGRNRSTCSYSG